MVARKIDARKYVLIGVLALVVLSFGLILGFLIDNERVRWVIQTNREQEVDFSSLQLQYLYISGLEQSNASCSVFKKALETSMADLGETLDKLLAYQKDSGINENEYGLLTRKYALDNLRFWIFAQKTRALCDLNFVTVLYFYSEKQCPICPSQGVLLTYFKKKFGDDLLVFPINVDLNENLVKIVTTRYNITSYPSLVVDKDEISGFTDKDTLRSLICKSFPHGNPSCA